MTCAPALADRRVCVAGIGVSGTAAAEVLLRRGADVVVVDARRGPAEQTRAAALELLGARVRLGQDATAGLPTGTDLVVTSPGFRPDSPLLAAAVTAGVPVWGEVELAWQLRPPGAAPWLALTGTNGKTTTVRMLAAILEAAGHRAVAVGNVGRPALEAVLAEPPYDVLAVELSSFQLHWSASLRPYAAAVLNVAPDHLDWHGSFEAYALAKHRIWRDPVNSYFLARHEGRWSVGTTLLPHDQPKVAVAVGNADDEVVPALITAAWAERRVTFTLREPRPGQLGVLDGRLVDRAFADAEPLAGVAEVHPAGPHNVANALAAAALARAYRVPSAAVRAGLLGYTPDPHRNAPVANIDGVGYVDDSKATNPHAAAASLSAYPSVVWIAGGLGKGLSFDDLAAAVAGQLRGVVLLGACRGELRAALTRHAPQIPVVEVERTDTGAMPAVVAAAVRLARPGDTVLLAPAAASMDMFTDYRDRGAAFAAAVHALRPTPRPSSAGPAG